MTSEVPASEVSQHFEVYQALTTLTLSHSLSLSLSRAQG